MKSTRLLMLTAATLAICAIAIRAQESRETQNAQDKTQAVTSQETKLPEAGSGAGSAIQDAGQTVPLPAGTANVSSEDFLTGEAKTWWLANVEPAQRRSACRLARADGMRRLAEHIAGVRITPNMTVKDFVAESDRVDVPMETFLVGARETGIRYHRDEPVVQIDMEVTMTSLYASLKSFGEVHCKGDQARLKKLEALEVAAKDTVIKAAGTGAAKTRQPVATNIAASNPATAPATNSATGLSTSPTTSPAAGPAIRPTDANANATFPARATQPLKATRAAMIDAASPDANQTKK